MSIHLRKLQSRVRTILVPYLFWNMVVFSITLLSQCCFSSIISGHEKLVADYSWQDWLRLFWNHQDGMPICYQFWFIRDLMVVVLFAPLLYCLLHYGRFLGLLVLGLLWLFNVWIAVPGFGITAVFFFSFGAFFSVHQRNPIADLYPFRIPATIMYLILVGVNTWLWHNGSVTIPYIHKTGVIAGLVATIGWTSQGICNYRFPVSTFLAASSFFVYAYHGKPAAIVMKCWVMAFAPMKEWSMLLGYIVIPFILISVGIALYALLHRYSPRFTALITGGR